jgi:regulator of sirC expression with transglutaminase-like and TPR domain
MTFSPLHAEGGARRALPLLLAAALLFAAGSARAEDDDAVQRLEDNVKRAYAEERHEDAFETLKTLYALTREPRDACNAGRTAFRLGRMVDAVEYLSVCEAMAREGGVRELSVRDKGVVAGAMADLVTAKERVGRLAVTASG